MLRAFKCPSSRGHVVYFANCGIGDEIGLGIANMAASSSPVAALLLPRNHITPLGIAHLCSALISRPAPMLRALDLSHNPIGDSGAAHLTAVLAATPSLRVLRIDNCEIGLAGAEALAGALVLGPRASSTTAVSGSPGARAADAEALAPAALAELSLAHNRVGDAGAGAFAAALARPGCALRALDLACCGVTGRGARALAAALLRGGNRTLERLRVLAVAMGREEEAALSALERAACAVSGGGW